MKTYRDAGWVIPTEFQYEIHGPMWQFECNTCDLMGDTYETEEGAEAERKLHACRPMPPEGSKFRRYQTWMGGNEDE